MTFSPTRALLSYAAAVVISGMAVVSVAWLLPLLGYQPIFFLAAVGLTVWWAGLRPAVLTTVLCTLSFPFFFTLTDDRNQQLVHDLVELTGFPVVAAIFLFLLYQNQRRGELARERQVELATLLESMLEAVYIFNAEGCIVQVNRAGEELTGQSRDSLLGKDAPALEQRLAAEHDGKSAIEVRPVRRALQGEVIRNDRYTLTPAEGGKQEALLSVYPLRREGQVVGAMLIVRDVTELSQLQQRLADTDRHKAIGQLAAGIAHDFNNVLETIGQAAAVLEIHANRPAQERAGYLKMIENGVVRGAELIRRVREHLVGSAGQKRRVRPRQLLDEALELTRPLWQRRADIAVVRAGDSDRAVLADAADLRRVFTNLVLNALEAMPHGGRLTVRCEDENGDVVIRFEDTGVGIPLDKQAEIFRPYFTTKAGGTGLGLSGSQRIVLDSGGTISFDSAPGRGTRFSICLPAIAEPAGRKDVPFESPRAA